MAIGAFHHSFEGAVLSAFGSDIGSYCGFVASGPGRSPVVTLERIASFCSRVKTSAVEKPFAIGGETSVLNSSFFAGGAGAGAGPALTGAEPMGDVMREANA